MTKGLDDLLRYLVQQIALQGETGASPHDVACYTNTFYDTRSSTDGGLAAESPSTTTQVPSQAVDRPFLAQVWSWLVSNSDITLGPNQTAQNLSLTDVEAHNEAIAAGQQPGQDIHHLERPDPIAEERVLNTEIRLYASDEQMWLALTGHGPDPRKIAAMEFTCLSVIGAQREQGILQPELVRVTGQDKRSLPERTNRLAEKGYIVKQKVLYNSAITSLCILKRFATTDDPQHRESLAEHDKFAKHEILIRDALDLIEEKRLITWRDLIILLDIPEGKGISTIIIDALRRFEQLGCLERLRLQRTDGYNPQSQSRGYRSIKFIKRPSPADWEHCQKMKRSWRSDPRVEQRSNSLSIAIDNPGRGSEGLEEEADLDEDLLDEEIETVIRWTPDRFLPNIAFEAIQQSGHNGLVTMDATAHITGTHYKRPLAGLLESVSDSWYLDHRSAPQHLTVLRDVAQLGRKTFYKFYDFNSFREVVELGRTSWEAVGRPAPEIEPQAGISSFEPLSPKYFYGQTGSSTIAECIGPALRQAQKGDYLRWGSWLVPKPRGRLSKKGNKNLAGSGNDHSTSDADGYPAESRPFERRGLNPRSVVNRKYATEYTAQELQAMNPEKRKKVINSINMGRLYHMKRIRAEFHRRLENGQGLDDAEQEIRGIFEAALSSQSTPSVQLQVLPQVVLEIRKETYMPSKAAHTTSCILSQVSERMDKKSTRPIAPLVSHSRVVRSKPFRSAIDYFPSIAAHTTAPCRTVTTTKRGRLPEQKPKHSKHASRPKKLPVLGDLLPDSTTVFPPVVLPSRVPEHQGPVTPSTSVVTAPRTQDQPVVSSRGRERKQTARALGLDDLPAGSIPKHKIQTLGPRVDMPLQTYEQQYAEMSPNSPGVHVSRLSRLRLSGKPVPPISRLVVFRSLRLGELIWWPRRENVGPLDMLTNDLQHAGGSLDKQSANNADLEHATIVGELLGEKPIEQMNTEGRTTSDSAAVTISTQVSGNSTRKRKRPSNNDYQGQIQEKSKPKTIQLRDYVSSPIARESSHVRQNASGKPLRKAQQKQAKPPRMSLSQTAGASANLNDQSMVGVDKHRQNSNALLGPYSPKAEAPPGKQQTQEQAVLPIAGEERHTTRDPGKRSLIVKLRVAMNSGKSERSDMQAKASDELQEPSRSREDATNDALLPAGGCEGKSSKYIAPSKESTIPALESSKTSNAALPLHKTTTSANSSAKNSTMAGNSNNDTVKTSRVARTPQASPQSRFSLISASPAKRRRSSTQTGERQGAGIRIKARGRWGGSLLSGKKEIVMSIVQKCDGVFPGDREMWFPFTTQWTKSHGEGTPDTRTVTLTIKQLVDAGKLRKLSFNHQTKKGEVKIKSILTLPGVPPNDAKVQALRKKMIELHPRLYVPPAAEVDEAIRRQPGSWWTPGKDRDNWAEDKVLPMPLEALPMTKDLQVNMQKGGKLTAVERLRAWQDDFNQQRRQWLKEQEETENNLSEPDESEENGKNNRWQIGKRMSLERLDSEINRQLQKKQNKLKQKELDEADELLGEPDFAVSGYNHDVSWLTRATFKDNQGQFDTFGRRLAEQGHTNPKGFHPIRRVHARKPYTTTATKILHHTSEGAAAERQKRLDRLVSLGLMDRNMVAGTQTISVPPPAAKVDPFVRIASKPAIRYARPPKQRTISEVGTEPGADAALLSRNKLRFIPSGEFQGSVVAPASLQRPPDEVHRMDFEQQFFPTFGIFGTFLECPTWFVPKNLEEILVRNYDPKKMMRHVPESDAAGYFNRVIDAVMRWEMYDPSAKTPSKMLTWINFTAQPPKPGRVPRMRPVLIPQTRRLNKLESVKRPNGVRPLKRRGLAVDNIQPGDTPRKRTRYRAKKADEREPDEDQQIMLAIVITKTLFRAGDPRYTNWGIVNTILGSKFDLAGLKRRWHLLRKPWKNWFRQTAMRFEELYLTAYEAGKVPPLDYEHVSRNDWGGLMDWAVSTVITDAGPEGQVKDMSKLPGTRASLDKGFLFEPQQKSTLEDIYEVKLKSVRPVNRRRWAHTRSTFLEIGPTAPHEKKHELPSEALARSWVRANAVTPQESYDPHAAKKKLHSVPDLDIDSACSYLLAAKVFMLHNKGRAMPGRTVDVSERFMSNFKANLEAKHYQQAVECKRMLDQEFRMHGKFNWSYHATDGEAIAVINLLASGRIRAKAVGMRSVPMGLLEGSYMTRTMDKDLLRFSVELQPTGSWVDGNPLLPLPQKPRCTPRTNAEGTDITPLPVWIDINGNEVDIIWEHAMCVLMSITAIRPGVTAEEVGDYVKPSLEAWEIKMLMQWAVDAGAATWVNQKHDGLRLRQWWWLWLG